MCFGGESSQAWQGQAHRVTAAKCNYHATKASWLIHWHMVHADGAYASVAARSPSLLPEMIDGNLRGLDKVFAECTWTSVRAFLAQRLCDRDGGFVAARSLLLFLQLPSRTVLILFLSKQKTGESPFCVPNFKRSQRRPVGPAAAYPLCETRSKADSTLFETASPGV